MQTSTWDSEACVQWGEWDQKLTYIVSHAVGPAPGLN